MTHTRIATVLVDGQHVTGAVYHVRENGWPCVETATGRIASGPEFTPCPHCGRAPADADGCACEYCRGYAHRPIR